jgi:single-strand DNA-binding protein
MAELMVYGVGVATADPESRLVGDKQTSLCTVNLAFNRSIKDGDNWRKEPCFIRAQAWGGRAERMSQLVTKGQPIFVSGYLRQESWEDKENKKRTSFTLVVEDFQLCVKNGESKSTPSTKSTKSDKASSPKPKDSVPPAEPSVPDEQPSEEDAIPF